MLPYIHCGLVWSLPRRPAAIDTAADAAEHNASYNTRSFKHSSSSSFIPRQPAVCVCDRDTVQVYKQLAEAGLEYGPAFRLLRNVHVPLPDN